MYVKDDVIAPVSIKLPAGEGAEAAGAGELEALVGLAGFAALASAAGAEVDVCWPEPLEAAAIGFVFSDLSGVAIPQSF